MRALIIAAGMGSRLRHNRNDTPKPLNTLLGLTLIERVILSAKEAGIKDFVITLGFQAKRIMDYLRDGKRWGISIKYVHNSEWYRGNGASVLKAKEKLNSESFILLMADHIFSPYILKKLKGYRIEDGCVMVVQKNLKKITSLEDETKVRIENGYVTDIHRNLEKFDGIDAGIFLCSPTIFKTLEKSIQYGKGSLTEGLSLLVKKRKLLALEYGDGILCNINTPKDLKFARKLLLDSTKKPSDGIISKFLNRKISLFLTNYLVKTRITPNLLTILSFTISLVSGLLFLSRIPLWAGISAQISSIIDGMDGEVARIKFQKSRFGAYMDSILDRYGDAFIILSMTLSHYLFYHNFSIWIIGFFALIGSFMSMLTKERFHTVMETPYSIEREGWLRYIPMTRDVRLFIIMLAGITNQIFLGLLLLAILTNLKTILRLGFVKRITQR